MTDRIKWRVGGVLMVAGVTAACPDWVSAAGLDVWHLPGLQQQLEEAQEAEALLAAEGEAVEQRIEIKARLIADLTGGRNTLAATTDQFLALNRDHPDVMGFLQRAYPGIDDREMAARNVISYVEVHRFPSGAERTAVLHRLHAEFGRLFPAPAPSH